MDGHDDADLNGADRQADVAASFGELPGPTMTFTALTDALDAAVGALFRQERINVT